MRVPGRFGHLAAVMLLLPVFFSVAGAQTILTDAQLLALSRDTYQREDWIYAALHMNALIQRNPAAVRNDPNFAKQLQDGLKYASDRLQEDKRVADEYRRKQKTAEGSDDGKGVGQVHSGLTQPPPRISWPKH